MSWDILITCPSMVRVLDEYRSRLSELGLNPFEVNPKQQLSAVELLKLIERFDGVIAGDDEFNQDVLRAGAEGKLKAISKWGVGTDNIDMEAAARFEIAVRNTPGLLGAEVADVALGYIILLARQLHRIDRAVRHGEWFKPIGESLAGKVLGLVGAGSVGHALAKRVLGLDMKIVVSDTSSDALLRIEALGAIPMNLDELVSSADFVVLACPLTPGTHKMIDARRLALMKPTASLINVSRGALIDEAALIAALESQAIRGAALDVYEREPLAVNSPLTSMDQAILGSHNASNTREAIRRVTHQAIENLVAALPPLPLGA